MNNKIPIFVISLKSSTARRKKISKHFNELGLPFEWVDAVIGKDLTEEQIDQLCHRETINKYPAWLTKGALGCALSHYYLYLEIIKRDIPVALIMEDDAILNKNFLTDLNHISKALNDNEVVSLFYCSHEPTRLITSSKKNVGNNYDLYIPENAGKIGSTAAYVITNAACKTLSDIILPIRTAADGWDLFISSNGVENFRCVYPRPVDTYDAKSTIEYVSNKNLASLAKWVDNHRVFPLYQILKIKRNRLKQQMKRVEFV